MTDRQYQLGYPRKIHIQGKRISWFGEVLVDCEATQLDIVNYTRFSRYISGSQPDTYLAFFNDEEWLMFKMSPAYTDAKLIFAGHLYIVGNTTQF